MPPAHAYLMESDDEGNRLTKKTDLESTKSQLVLTGLTSLPQKELSVVDAGCGAGLVSGVMAELLSNAYTNSKLFMLDASEDRLKQAALRTQPFRNVQAQPVQCDLTTIPLGSKSVDYLFCRFVFEYLPDPQAVMEEFKRVVRPGGKIIVGDLDYNCLTHYPMEADLEKQLLEIMGILTAKKFLDPYVGRKLYSFFTQTSFRDVQLHLIPHHLFYGPLKENDEYNWTAKLDRLLEVFPQNGIKLSFDLEHFKHRFMQLLKSPDRFTYTPLILLEGTAS